MSDWLSFTRFSLFRSKYGLLYLEVDKGTIGLNTWFTEISEETHYQIKEFPMVSLVYWILLPSIRKKKYLILQFWDKDISLYPQQLYYQNPLWKTSRSLSKGEILTMSQSMVSPNRPLWANFPDWTRLEYYQHFSPIIKEKIPKWLAKLHPPAFISNISWKW